MVRAAHPMTFLAFLDQISGWWENLNLARQLFYGIGIIAGLVSLVLAVLAFIGMEHTDAIDAVDVAGVDHGGGGIFSIKPLTGFFLGFGWGGGIALDAGLALGVALVIALGSGAGIMAIVVWMFRAILMLKSDGTVRIKEALGAVGTVYVTVPPRKAAGGQVVVNFSGRQETLAALTSSAQPLASGEKVKVVAIIDGSTVQVETL
jgi:hypothetical protein